MTVKLWRKKLKNLCMNFKILTSDLLIFSNLIQNGDFYLVPNFKVIGFINASFSTYYAAVRSIDIIKLTN